MKPTCCLNERFEVNVILKFLITGTETKSLEFILGEKFVQLQK